MLVNIDPRQLEIDELLGFATGYSNENNNSDNRPNIYQEPEPFDYSFRVSDEQRNSDELTKHINTYPYKLINIPEIYATRSAFELHPSTFGPIKQPFGYEVGSGKFTINWMIQNFSREVPFEFANWEDCVEAADKLRQYVERLEKEIKEIESEEIIAKDKEVAAQFEKVQNYCNMAKRLDATLYPLARRLKHFHTVESFEERKKRTNEIRRKVKFGIATEEEQKTYKSMTKFDFITNNVNIRK